MNWLLYSLPLPLFSLSFSLLTKWGKGNTDGLLYTLWVLISSTILGMGYFLYKGNKIKITIETLIGGISYGIALAGLIIGIGKAANPALPQSAYRFQTALTFIGSYLLFKSKMTGIAILGIVLTLLGVYLLSDKEDSKNKQQETKILGLPEWFVYAAGGGVALTVKDLVSVSYFKKGLKPINFTSQQSLWGGIVILLLALFTNRFDSLKNLNHEELIKSVSSSSLLGVINILWTTILVIAMGLAPNAGYPKAITDLGIVLTALASSYLFKGSDLTMKEWGGVASMVAGVMLVTI